MNVIVAVIGWRVGERDRVQVDVGDAAGAADRRGDVDAGPRGGGPGRVVGLAGRALLGGDRGVRRPRIDGLVEVERQRAAARGQRRDGECERQGSPVHRPNATGPLG
jgi:hypothetical protein